MAIHEANCLRRLSDIHANMTRLKGSTNELLKVANFDQQLDDLGDAIACLKEVDKLASKIARISTALELLVSLFEQSSDQKIDGGAIQCLLQPMQQEIDRVFDRLQVIL